jgi:N-acetylglucosaminyl-diphospho-decaprenol L-rhamnosyltransferase
MTVLVTVVVVSWNGGHLLPDCLTALEQQTLERVCYEVVVVDNASVDGTPELVATRFPRVRLLRNAENRGFAGGCNTALRDVRTPFVLLVNNDAVVAPDVLERMLAAAQAPGGERTAAWTARVLLAPRFVRAEDDEAGSVRLPDGRVFRPLPEGSDAPGAVDLVNSTGNQIRTDGAAEDRGWLAVDGEQGFDADVFGFCGAAALLRTAAARELGWFDERYFVYYEDVDLSWRLRLRGWTAGYVADAVVRHAHGQTSGEGSSLHRFHDDRNRLLTLAKNAPAGMAVRLTLRHLAVVALLARREGRPWSTTRTRLRALASYVCLLPHALLERRALSRTAALRRSDVPFVAPRHIGGYRAEAAPDHSG